MFAQNLIFFQGSKFLLCSILIFAGVLMARPEDNSQTPRVGMVTIDLILVPVSVRDKNGALVKDLTYKDFMVLEDKREQPILTFTRGTTPPLTIGLIVDSTPGEIIGMEEEKTASRIFLNRMIRPGEDHAFIIRFGNKVELLQDLTSAPENLAEAIHRLEPRSLAAGISTPSTPDKKPAPNPGSAVTDGSSSSTLLSESIRLAAEKISTPAGRKALIILCGGAHIGKNRETAIVAALKAATPVYPIRIFPNEFARKSRPSESAMEKDLKMLANKTGGTYFELGKQASLESIYKQIEEELQNQYILGYHPDSNKNAKEGFRTISAKIKKEGFAARALEGYYIPR
jgi:VWFA-related protein